MDLVCHRKVMDKLEIMERKIDRVNNIYIDEYIMINRNFMRDLIITICFVSVIVLSFCSYFKLI